MQAADQGPGGAEGQGSPGNSGGSDGPASHEGPGRGGTGDSGVMGSGASWLTEALQPPMPDGSALPDLEEHAASEQAAQDVPTAGPQRHLAQFFLTVPFPTPIEAEMARRCMVPFDQPQQGAVQKEFVVFGNILAIRLTAEDPDLLQISITSCLEQIDLLVRIMQHFVPTNFHYV